MSELTSGEPKEPTLDEKPKATRKRRSPGRKTSLEPALRAQLELVGRLWAVRDETCGTVMLDSAGSIAAALNMMAMDDPKIYERLSMASTGGGWVGLFMATSPLLAVVTSHHLAPMVQRRREARDRMEADVWAGEGPPPIPEPGENASIEDNRFNEDDFDRGR